MSVLSAGQAPAQEAVLALDFGASYSLPPAGVTDVASTYANGGIRLAGLFGEGGYYHAAGSGGLALREEGASWASVLAEGGWSQPISRTVSLGLALGGEAFTVGQPAPYRAAYVRVEPEIGFEAGGTSIRLGGYGGIGASEVTVIRTFVRDTRFGPRQYEFGFPVASNLWAWGGAVEIGHRLGALSPRLAVEAYESPQGPYVVGRLGLEVGSGVGTFYVEGAVWDTPDGGEFVAFAGVRVHTGGGPAILASGGRYGPDPLLDSAAAGSLAAAVRLDLARFGPVRELGWEIMGDGEPSVSLALRAPGATSVDCLGDFTGWEPVPMVRDGEIWRLDLPIEPGAHHFGFLVDGDWYVPPDAPGLTADEWGGMQATIVVGERADPPDVTP